MNVILFIAEYKIDATIEEEAFQKINRKLMNQRTLFISIVEYKNVSYNF